MCTQSLAAPIEVQDNEEKRLLFFAEYFDYDKSWLNGFELEDVLVNVEMINSAPNNQTWQGCKFMQRKISRIDDTTK